MSPIEATILAEKAAAIEQHLGRVEARLPADGKLEPLSDATDAVILHLWQAIQLMIDLAMSAAVRVDGATPRTYADAFRSLGRAGTVPEALAERLARAASFRNRIVHAYGSLDLDEVARAAQTGPADVRAFLACLTVAASR